MKDLRSGKRRGWFASLFLFFRRQFVFVVGVDGALRLNALRSTSSDGGVRFGLRLGVHGAFVSGEGARQRVAR